MKHPPTLPVYRQIGYASGNFGKSTIWSFLEIFALFYFTDILGISPSIAGIIIMLSLIWDGITDPLMGIAADKFKNRLTTIQPFFVIGAPLTAMTFVALFQATAITGTYKIAYVFIILISFRLAYTIVDVPHNSMLSFLSQDSRIRTNIASMRIFFSAIGKFIVSLASIFVLSEHHTFSIETRFSIASIAFALIYLCIMACCFICIRDIRIQNSTKEPTNSHITDILKNIIANKQLLIVFALTAITSFTTPVISIAILYFAKYSLNNESFAANALALMSAAQAISLLFWSFTSNRLSQKKYASQIANCLLFIAMLFAVIYLESGITLYIMAVIAGFAIGGIYMLNWSILPDSIDYGETLTGQRHDMSVFGLYTLTNKVFIGLSQAMVGWVMVFYGYNANSEMEAKTINNIITTLLSAPLCGTVLCIILLHYHIIKQKKKITNT